MPITGLLVTLPDDPELRRRTLQHVDAEPHLTPGPRRGGKLVVVAETDGVGEDQAVVDALERIDGVFVEVAYYDFSDVRSVERPPGRRRRRAPLNEGGDNGAA
ncbi:MAG: hypothetical protein PVI30_17600 [Myxococcales bacterium]|jgi:hypothetical protein